MIVDLGVEKKGVEILGHTIHRANWDETLEFIRSAVASQHCVHIQTANVDHLMIAQRDPEFSEVLKHADLVTADGMPLVWASKLLGKPISERVAGSDIVMELCRRSGEWGLKLFFLGAAPGVAEDAKRQAILKYPGVSIVGVYSPASWEVEDTAANKTIVEQINDSNANVLLVALGAPKQEKWITCHMDALKTNVNIGIGASLDFLAGKIERAPLWMQKSGLEWLYRFFQEPSRLWRRYLIQDMPFFLGIFKQWWEYRFCKR